ncbi:type II secretion system F family protein [Paraburkholderia kururiensis]|uniref:Type II secretion system F family protein n=1 Tax=Paraburkholderia kururiensis TaxID=984307 RepID=A0ABZ0WT11_9BURK|nr:type II secretion system F family protein [Paraburkholderia kururiensis]WQD80356.1 type II secretion system F family protein [Paraburkholderia kururiensis]
MSAGSLFAAALVLAALGCALLAAHAVVRLAGARRSARTLAVALEARAAAAAMASSSAAAAAAQVAARMGAGTAAGAAAGGGTSANSTVGAGSGAAARAGAGMATGVNGMVGMAGPGARAADRTTAGTNNRPRSRGLAAWVERLADAGVRWLDTPFGRQAVADEERRLLEQCGFVDARSRGLFLMARVASAMVVAAFAGWFMHGGVAAFDWMGSSGVTGLFVPAAGLVLGFMVPKLYVQRRAAGRRRAVVDELPMLVDLLRLLQGVGLSLDQSLQVLVNEFRGVLPVLAGELEIAQRQFTAGRTREQSLQRVASSYDNEDLRAVVRLLIQVDRHGGAVQEPLRQFGDRLREVRRAMLRERIGRLTVKMTAVMILTLLPALLIVTAGPGVVSVTHSLVSVRPHR